MTETQHRADEIPPSQVPPAIESAPQIPHASGPSDGVIQSNTSTLDSVHGDFAAFHEGYVRHYIGLADTKAAWTFTIAAGVIAYVFGSHKFQGIMADPVCSAQFIFFAAVMASLVGSAFCSFLVIAPRLKSASGEGIVYFGSVANRKNANNYVRDVASKNESELTEARLKHCYDISGICAKKYKYLKYAIWFGLPSLIGMTLVLLLV